MVWTLFLALKKTTRINVIFTSSAIIIYYRLKVLLNNFDIGPPSFVEYIIRMRVENIRYVRTKGRRNCFKLLILQAYDGDLLIQLKSKTAFVTFHV